jgi:hypothetical protein
MAGKKSRTAEVKEISGFSETDAGQLVKDHVETVNALWGENCDDLAERLGRIAQTSGVKLELLYTILISDALGALRRKGRVRSLLAAASRHKGELAFIALLLLAIVLIVYRGVTAGTSFAPRVVVKAGSKLTPFRNIDPADLTLEEGMPTKGTFSSVEQFAGRYPSETLAEGKPVTETKLLSKELSSEVGKRHLLALPVEQGTAVQEIKTPATVWLLLPSHDEKIPTAVLVKDVLLLAVRRNGGGMTATIAVTEQGLTEMKNCIGRIEAIIIQPAA